MNRREEGTSGLTLVELLIVMAVFGTIMVVVSSFMASQTRAVGLSQATNDAEMTARTIAEAVVQDLQLAGSRAVLLATGVYPDDILDGGCDENNRQECVEARSVSDDGSVNSSTSSVNGYTIRYLTSTFPAEPCRSVVYALLADGADGVLYRSDRECAADTAIGAINLDASAFASNVTEFALRFECSDGSDSGDFETVPPTSGDPVDCYGSADTYVRQVAVLVGVELPGRFRVASAMEMVAFTPNLRPSVNYGRTEVP